MINIRSSWRVLIGKLCTNSPYAITFIFTQPSVKITTASKVTVDPIKANRTFYKEKENFKTGHWNTLLTINRNDCALTN